MVVITVKATIRRVYQYLNGGRKLYNRALAFGVRYPGLFYLAASLGFLACMRGVRSEDTNGLIADHTHVGTLMCIESVSCSNVWWYNLLRLV